MHWASSCLTWLRVLETQRSCTGVAMYRANVGIVPTGHALDAVLATGSDREQAFASAGEFVKHHEGK